MSEPNEVSVPRCERVLVVVSGLGMYAGWMVLPLVGRAGLDTAHAGTNRLAFALVWSAALIPAALLLRHRLRRPGRAWMQGAWFCAVLLWGLLGISGAFGV